MKTMRKAKAMETIVYRREGIKKKKKTKSSNKKMSTSESFSEVENNSQVLKRKKKYCTNFRQSLNPRS